jgi:hypothetical protein
LDKFFFPDQLPKGILYLTEVEAEIVEEIFKTTLHSDPKNIITIVMGKSENLRGHTIFVEDKTYATITGEKIQINLKELCKCVVIQDGKYPMTELHPTAILYLRMGGFYPKEWRDAKQPLEAQIPAIISRLEQQAARLKEQNDHYRQIREKQEEKTRLLQEAEQKKEKDRADFKALLDEAKKWKQAQILTEYLDILEKTQIDLGQLNDRFREWLTWARRKVDELEPAARIGGNF